MSEPGSHATAAEVEVSFQADVIHQRLRSRAIMGAAIWTVLAPFLFVATGKLVGPPGGGPPSWLGWALLGIVGSGVATATAIYRAARRAGRFEVHTDRVTLIEGGKRRDIAKRSIENAMLVAGDGQSELLELSLIGGEVLLLDFGDAQRARAARLQLDLANERNVTRIRMYQRGQDVLTSIAGGIAGAMVGGFAAASVAPLLGGFAPFLIMAVMIPAMLYGARWARRQLPEVSVGSDGVAIRRANQPLRFVPHDNIRAIETVRRDLPKNPSARVLELATEDGERHTLAIHFAAQEVLADALEQRVREAIRERRTVGAPLPTFADLERQGRPTTKWLEALRALGRTHVDYRRADLSSEALEGLLADGSTAAEHRLGAAVVLAARGEPAAKERIRIASENSADPAVKKALLAVAEAQADEEAVAEAVDAIARERAS